MSSVAARIVKQFISSARPSSALVWDPKVSYSTASFDADNDGGRSSEVEDLHDDIIPEKQKVSPQGVDPRRGWNFRGVHKILTHILNKAIICGKVRQAPVQKLLRNGRTLTILNVGTGGMWDHRILGAKDLPKPAQWHRVVVHNEALEAEGEGKEHIGVELEGREGEDENSSVYVEGDIELRVYNKGVTGETVKLPEICVRHDGYTTEQYHMTPNLNLMCTFKLQACSKQVGFVNDTLLA
ncbi:hypothetical protein Cgig2_018053 [Carnegiea gigantea]|uniref:Single-stranded DNA-binding protein, mitochondrial n=1 Tax=Carnegiea gigantea TaxID=171969 RepID=A0A9Q1GWV4_9CARY|nr:hypothetical protein Cgig2_018053 [Carnegiea gigantea]